MEQQSYEAAAKEAVIDVGSGEGVLVDVRRDDEWAEGHAVGAIHWDLALLQKGEMPDIPKDTKVFTHCAAGGRSEEAKKILEENGWQHVTNIGGLGDWESAGGEVEK